MEQILRKTSIRIWTPLVEGLNQTLDAACLRRDAWLTRVLKEECDRLDTEIADTNSEAAQHFIAAHLDTVPRKLVTLTLPDELMRRLDEICERKRIVRDSFFNRLYFLLSANHRWFTAFYFDGDRNWLTEMLEETDFSSRAVGALLSPVPTYHNPFATLREGLATMRDRLARESGRLYADEWLAEHGVYTLLLADSRFGNSVLYGLCMHVPDSYVPGTAEHQLAQAMLDDLLPDDQPPPEQTP